MASYTTIKPRNIDISGDYVVNSISVTGNTVTGNLKTDHLLYANGTPYVFTTNAAGTNTQVQFNDGNSFAGSANLTFNKTTGTLTVAHISGDGANIANVNALTLNGHSDTYFATSTQGGLADSAVQPGANISVFTNDSGYLVSSNLSTYATKTYVDDGIANLVNSAPAALDTLNELAIALGNDASYSTTITNALANKLSTSAFTSTADAWLATKSTTNVSEGTNQYYTVARANSAIDARVTKSFVDNLAVVANIANTAYVVAGANVTGFVPNANVANTAYSVAVANVSGIGNIATINKDGNASNILYGNGVFAAVPSTYSNSNVATYLPTYTGNLSPGNITIPVANLFVSGGNIGQVITTDGNGNLSWANSSVGTLSTVDSFTGDGSNAAFTLSTTPTSANYTIAVVHGMVQPKSTYTVVGNVITFSSAPASTASIEVTTLASGGGAGGGVGSLTWNIANSNITMSSNNGYFVDTSGGAKTMTLPSSATLGDTIRINDLAGSFGTNNLTVARNGHKIQGATQDLTVDVDQSSFGLVYSNSTYGWKVLEL